MRKGINAERVRIDVAVVGQHINDDRIVFVDRCRIIISDRIVTDRVHRHVKGAAERTVVALCRQIAVEATIFHGDGNRGGAILVGDWREGQASGCVRRGIGDCRVGDEAGRVATRSDLERLSFATRRDARQIDRLLCSVFIHGYI